MLMAVLGQSSEAEDEIAYLWPCNVATWQHWLAVQTQWRVGMSGGATGLDYAGVRAYLKEAIRKPSKRRATFAGIRAAERGDMEGRSEASASGKK